MTVDPTRRTLLSLTAVSLGTLAGCLNAPGDRSDTDRTVRISSKDDPPSIPVRPAVEVVAASPTTAHPAKLRTAVTNTSEDPISVGEERAIVFAYVHSVTRPGLVLLPAAESVSPPRDGCWRLTEPIAIAEYYGVVELSPGESTERTLAIWGGPERTEGCLPTGEYRFETTLSGGPAPDGGIDPPEWTASWGFDLIIE